MQTGGTVLVLGSAPHAVICRNWEKTRDTVIVAINNAWRLRADWDFLVYPDDFPAERHPAEFTDRQQLVGSEQFVPAQNRFGGFVYAGGTMAFTAGYWALATLRPRRMIFVGCDMVYPETGKTHFYGDGAADPLRLDPSLRNLEAKSARLMLTAAKYGCTCLRASDRESRLLFPAVDGPGVGGPMLTPQNVMRPEVAAARAEEERLNYFVASGRYWEVADRFSTTDIDRLDDMWLNAFHACGIGEMVSAA